MTVIVQITPEIGAGTGVGGVAAQLEVAWRAQGVEVRRFTMREAGGSWIPEPAGGLTGKLALMTRVVWFSSVGTVFPSVTTTPWSETCTSITASCFLP